MVLLKMSRLKIICHVIAISLFLIGFVFIHIILNLNPYTVDIHYYTTVINKYVLTDLGLIFIGISFFIEFILTFKPVEIIKQKHIKKAK